MKKKIILFVFSICFLPIKFYAQNSLGTIQANTNNALPSSYNFQEYVFAEPNDQGECIGNINNSAEISGVYFAQTHRHKIDHPFFFIIGQRPALLQLAITGTGISPDVKVEGFMNGNSLGTLCLKGPQILSNSIDENIPNFEDYFSVTLPKIWVKNGLTLQITVGSSSIFLSQDELKIGPYTELNMVMYNMDVLDYNTEPHRTPIIDRFLQELASAIPASTIRFGIFPEKIVFPEIIANNETEQLVRLKGRSDMQSNGIYSDGSINSIALLFLSNLHRSTGDYLSTVYFGNTLNLSPGGWGGGKSFVSFDYDDVFIHELGHALSLPHWGESAYNISNPDQYQYLYPYGGANDDGGGRGESWNFIQDIYEFIDPTCHFNERGIAGLETSDAMQRNNHCFGERSEGKDPWDGFGDFSALAIHKYLVGNAVTKGKVHYRNEDKDYQLNMQGGFPIVSEENGKRTYKRDPAQNQEIPFDQQFKVPGEEKTNVPVYLIYGTAHEFQSQANIVYKPIKFNGTLPPILDPTNAITFEHLKDPQYLPHMASPRDITLKLTYKDGTVLHALNPFHSYARTPYDWGFHIWRNDICNFSLVVPGDKELIKVELYKRPFVLRYSDDPIVGNINDESQNITAENFMDDAEFQAEYVFGSPPVLGSNSIGNRVWHDLNQNGLDDFGEPGIEGVKLLLWGDSNNDGIPDYEKYLGATITDENGYYRFTGLGPGNYLVFVWSLENWEEGRPLHNMVSSGGYSDPNNDINNDNNGRQGFEFPGLGEYDYASGIITLTADGEPLNDGDRIDDWFDYDPSGNMTVDFGFHFENDCANINGIITGTENLCPGNLGQLSVEVINGEGPYTFHWSTNSTNSVIENLNVGDYIVTITDAKGCKGEVSYTINESENISGIITGEDLLCKGEMTTITVLPSNGIAPYSYLWNTNETTEKLENILPNIYSVVITDSRGCSGELSINITELDTIQVIIFGTDTICTNTLGNIFLEVNGSNLPYSYLWNNGATTNNISNLEANLYSVTITDGNGCEKVESFEIIEENTAACSTSTNDSWIDSKVKIFPNPFSHSITIINELSDLLYFEIYDLQGKSVLEKIPLKNIGFINLEPLSKGMYLGVLKDEKSRLIKYQKLVKID